MSCLSPINILTNQEVNQCTNKCNLTYQNSIAEQDVVITNNGTYISVSITNNDNTANLDNSYYALSELQIYSPSLHQYNNTNQIGEILMVYNSTENSTEQLIISVPISQTGGSVTDQGFNNLMNVVNVYTPSEGDTSNFVVSDLNFNNFISTSSFYTYTGTVIDNCETTAYYILFYPTDFSIFIPNNYIYNNQITCINPSNITIEPNTNYFYNPNGANFGDGDGIYMDCVAVNTSEEEDLVPISNSNSNMSGSYGSYNSPALKNPTVILIFQYIIFCLFTIIIFGVIYLGINYFTKYLQA